MGEMRVFICIFTCRCIKKLWKNIEETKNRGDFRRMEVGTGQRARIGGNILLVWDANNTIYQKSKYTRKREGRNRKRDGEGDR